MSEINERTTALVPSVGADGGQPLHNSTVQSIPDENAELNPPEEDLQELYRRMQRMTDPHYLHTVSMTELYQTTIRADRQSSTACSTPGHILLPERRRSASPSLWRNSPIMSAQGKGCGATKSIPARCCILRWRMIFSVSRAGCS